MAGADRSGHCVVQRLHQRPAGEQHGRPTLRHRGRARDARRCLHRPVPACRRARRYGAWRGCRRSTASAARIEAPIAVIAFVQQQRGTARDGDRAARAAANDRRKAVQRPRNTLGRCLAEVIGCGERGQCVHRHVATGCVQPKRNALACNLGGDIAAVRVHREIDQPHVGGRAVTERHDARIARSRKQPRQQGRVGRQHRNAARFQPVQKLCLLVGDRLDASQENRYAPSRSR